MVILCEPARVEGKRTKTPVEVWSRQHEVLDFGTTDSVAQTQLSNNDKETTPSIPCFIRTLSKVASRTNVSTLTHAFKLLTESEDSTHCRSLLNEKLSKNQIKQLFYAIVSGYRNSSTLLPVDYWLCLAPTDLDMLALQSTNICGVPATLCAWKRFANLRVLDLSQTNFAHCSLDIFDTLLSSCQAVEALSLHDANVPDGWCGTGLTSLPLLKTLNLSSQHITFTCPMLQSLNSKDTNVAHICIPSALYQHVMTTQEQLCMKYVQPLVQWRRDNPIDNLNDNHSKRTLYRAAKQWTSHVSNSCSKSSIRTTVDQLDTIVTMAVLWERLLGSSTVMYDATQFQQIWDDIITKYNHQWSVLKSLQPQNSLDQELTDNLDILQTTFNTFVQSTKLESNEPNPNDSVRSPSSLQQSHVVKKGESVTIKSPIISSGKTSLHVTHILHATETDNGAHISYESPTSLPIESNVPYTSPTCSQNDSSIPSCISTGTNHTLSSLTFTGNSDAQIVSSSNSISLVSNTISVSKDHVRPNIVEAIHAKKNEITQPYNSPLSKQTNNQISHIQDTTSSSSDIDATISTSMSVVSAPVPVSQSPEVIFNHTQSKHIVNHDALQCYSSTNSSDDVEIPKAKDALKHDIDDHSDRLSPVSVCTVAQNHINDSSSTCIQLSRDDEVPTEIQYGIREDTTRQSVTQRVQVSTKQPSNTRTIGRETPPRHAGNHTSTHDSPGNSSPLLTSPARCSRASLSSLSPFGRNFLHTRSQVRSEASNSSAFRRLDFGSIDIRKPSVPPLRGVYSAPKKRYIPNQFKSNAIQSKTVPKRCPGFMSPSGIRLSSRRTKQLLQRAQNQTNHKQITSNNQTNHKQITSNNQTNHKQIASNNSHGILPKNGHKSNNQTTNNHNSHGILSNTRSDSHDVTTSNDVNLVQQSIDSTHVTHLDTHSKEIKSPTVRGSMEQKNQDPLYNPKQSFVQSQEHKVNARGLWTFNSVTDGGRQEVISAHIVQRSPLSDSSVDILQAAYTNPSSARKSSQRSSRHSDLFKSPHTNSGRSRKYASRLETFCSPNKLFQSNSRTTNHQSTPSKSSVALQTSSSSNPTKSTYQSPIQSTTKQMSSTGTPITQNTMHKRQRT